MQQASKGLGQFASGMRSLHVYAHPPRPPIGTGAGGTGHHVHAPRPPTTATSNATVTGRILQTTRTVFSRFLTHLTAPGFTHPVAGSTLSARGLSTRVNASVRPASIQSSLSLPARQVLGRTRAGPPFVPHATPASKSTVHVGLGTARNFSTARPLLQQFAANVSVPVAGRAIYEADWDVEKRKMKDKRREFGTAKSSEEKENVSASRMKPVEKTNKARELERYFRDSESFATPEVTTVLSVPLAPTPTSRLPLTETTITTSSTSPLLLVSDLQDILSTHRVHSLRVSSLFARLDACGVWEKGAKFSACGDSSGLCTVLRVEFKGWTEEMVRGVLGEAGKGWCRVVEVRHWEGEGKSLREDDLIRTPIGSVSSLASEHEHEHDPATSMVLPTLDFSASFHAIRASIDPQSIPPSPPASPQLLGLSSPLLSASELSYSPTSSDDFSNFELDMDVHSETGTDMDIVSDFDSGSEGTRTGSIISFSSDFLQRSAGNGNYDNYV